VKGEEVFEAGRQECVFDRHPRFDDGSGGQALEADVADGVELATVRAEDIYRVP